MLSILRKIFRRKNKQRFEKSRHHNDDQTDARTNYLLADETSLDVIQKYHCRGDEPFDNDSAKPHR